MNKKRFFIIGVVILLSLSLSISVGAQSSKIIFDTDYAIPPQDDGMAAILALNSPKIEVLGFTTVAGNRSVERATADLLRTLEITKRTEVPVYEGSNMPLVHEESDFAHTVWGEWWSDEEPPMPPGGFAQLEVAGDNAVEFMIDTVMENPNEITIVAIGPLTNVAKAIRKEADFTKNVKEIIIMGGAIANLPRGGGNVTPNAEFNFWVDPEAAKVVLRSGAPIVLSPLNASRTTALTKEWYEKMVEVETPITEFIRETMGPRYEEDPDRSALMYDQLAVATLIDRDMFEYEEMYVDVDINHGMNYGTSVGWNRTWPGAEGAKKILVQYDSDWEKFIKMFVDEITKPIE